MSSGLVFQKALCASSESMTVFSFAFKEVRNQRFLDCLTPSASGQIVWDCQCLWSQVPLLFSIVELAYVQHITVKESNRGEIRLKSQKSESSKNAQKCFKSEIRTKQQHTQMLIFLCLDSGMCVIG
jgi:hypothetical protein